jgi:hypothetical protein
MGKPRSVTAHLPWHLPSNGVCTIDYPRLCSSAALLLLDLDSEPKKLTLRSNTAQQRRVLNLQVTLLRLALRTAIFDKESSKRLDINQLIILVAHSENSISPTSATVQRVLDLDLSIPSVIEDNRVVAITA